MEEGTTDKIKNYKHFTNNHQNNITAPAPPSLHQSHNYGLSLEGTHCRTTQVTLFQSLLPTPTEQKPRRLMFKVYRHQQNRNPGHSRSKSTTDTYRTETQATHTPQSSTDTNRTETQTNHLQSLPTPTEQKPTRFTFKVHRHQQNRKSLRKNNNNINNNNNKRTETHAAHVQSLLPTPTEQISRRADRTARRHGLTFKVYGHRQNRYRDELTEQPGDMDSRSKSSRPMSPSGPHTQRQAVWFQMSPATARLQSRVSHTPFTRCSYLPLMLPWSR